MEELLPEGVDFFIQQFKEPRWEELEVLNVGLFGWTWGFGRLRLGDTKCLTEVRVNRVVGFALPFRRLNPTLTKESKKKKSDKNLAGAGFKSEREIN